MSDFNRPTLTQLVGQAQDDINARIPGADSRLRRSVLGVLARVFAGLVHGLYGYLDWLALQLLVSTCTSLVWLKLHGAIWGLTLKAATFATGTITVTGTDDAPVEAGSVLQIGALRYEITATTAIDGASVVAHVICLTAGVAGNLPTGATLTFVSPGAGIASAATVIAVTGGADEEAMEAYRARILARIRNPPQGGSDADYEGWTLEIPQATRAWVFAKWSGRGTVGISFVCDGRDNIIPTSDDRAAVFDHITAPNRKPTPADIIVFSPVAQPLNPSIRLTPDTTAVRTAVTAELKDLLSREASVKASTLLLSHINESISLAAGETDHDLVSPVAPVASPDGHIVTLGDIDWGD